MPKLVEIPVPQMETGAPLPVLFAEDGRTAVVYWARTTPDAPLIKAAVEFEPVSLMKFGYPNDEGIRSHSLFDMDGDLWPYAMYEALDSPWIEEHIRNLRVTYSSDTDFSNIRHFIWIFHDSTLEILCRGFRVLSEEETANLDRLASQWVR